ncbi:hypothetical protein CHLNCDRAFT_140492 [Chlorella variabilis]|uniref:CHK kinase-like domain-containing protein n=1 Tax=Chlorella variabilis TaxID=554065 RepID=E1Z5H7_CHLVA|nr:hypothetical protein CHLNCDRAFT_140492 [Chlorella variabilis]EFN58473.1 hypothetical protein CHLNCDRAFT_140492 [Chlorella variabilis]|eukprot:XP_005850575.1 hypothetical protein CHLNCDRAFT_140492 [Chlorella variabilis]
MARSSTGRCSGGGRGSTPAEQRAQAAIAAATHRDGEAVPTGVRSARPLSSLWAGYGTITEVETDDEPSQLLIVKEVAPPPGSGVSHARKMRSYQIEAAFYQRVAPHLPPGAACHVPHCLGVHSTLDADSSSDAGGMQLVMSDLRQRFPNSCSSLDEQHARAALSWLAAFHAACWGADAERLGLWPEGCYWHLETRLEELADIGREGRALQAAAHELDHRLRQTPFRTLTHGDYKTANLLFGSGSDECAAYDFQYVGGGSGMKDVVYLFCSGLSARLLAQQEEVLLRHYHGQLIEGLRAAAGGGGSTGIADPAAAAEAVERYTYEAMLGDYRLALCDYVRFMAGWGFWGNTSWASTKARQFLGELGLTS